jgi:hypothetical protein
LRFGANRRPPLESQVFYNVEKARGDQMNSNWWNTILSAETARIYGTLESPLGTREVAPVRSRPGLVKTIVLTVLALVVLIPAGAAFSTQPSFDKPATGVVEIDTITIVARAAHSDAPSIAPAPHPAPIAKAIRKARSAPAKANLAMGCRSRPLEAGGRPDARNVWVWEPGSDGCGVHW